MTRNPLAYHVYWHATYSNGMAIAKENNDWFGPILKITFGKPPGADQSS
jgi:hypothetical protein